MTSFCVGEASRDLTNTSVDQTIRHGINSLVGNDWRQPDIIFMNPPFKAWEDLDEQERRCVEQILGANMAGRPDLSLAFIVRAALALKHGGVFASVVPSTFFSAKGTEKVRKFLSDGDYRIRMVGIFRGFETFGDALVEAGILVVAKSSIETPIRVMISEKDQAERATRLLRTIGPTKTLEYAGAAIFNTTATELNSGISWTLRHPREVRFARTLVAHTNSLVKDVFKVRLGIRGVGAKNHEKVLLLNDEESQRILTPNERKFFRPIADKIENGRIHPTGFVFYPYGTDRRLLLETEKHVANAAPSFYNQVLLPAKHALESRQSINRRPNANASRHWWEPSEPVTTWLAAHTFHFLIFDYRQANQFNILSGLVRTFTLVNPMTNVNSNKLCIRPTAQREMRKTPI